MEKRKFNYYYNEYEPLSKFLRILDEYEYEYIEIPFGYNFHSLYVEGDTLRIIFQNYITYQIA